MDLLKNFDKVCLAVEARNGCALRTDICKDYRRIEGRTSDEWVDDRVAC